MRSTAPTAVAAATTESGTISFVMTLLSQSS
jgi:hypothetical protein